jgi:FeS assembly protein IscX
MTTPFEFNRLYWESPYALVRALMEAHPVVDFETLGIAQVQAWIIALPEFVDDPALAHDDMLEEILSQWYEEANAE